MKNDIVFEQNYESRVRVLVENAHKQGQAVGIETLMKFMREFEAKHIEITVKGITEYMASVNYKPTAVDPVEDVIQRAEVAIKKAEEILPIPDNVVQLFGKKNANTNVQLH